MSWVELRMSCLTSLALLRISSLSQYVRATILLLLGLTSPNSARVFELLTGILLSLPLIKPSLLSMLSSKPSKTTLTVTSVATSSMRYWYAWLESSILSPNARVPWPQPLDASSEIKFSIMRISRHGRNSETSSSGPFQ